MLVTQSVCCDVFDGDVWLGKYCAKIFAIGIFLRILTGIDTDVACYWMHHVPYYQKVTSIKPTAIVPHTSIAGCARRGLSRQRPLGYQVKRSS